MDPNQLPPPPMHAMPPPMPMPVPVTTGPMGGNDRTVYVGNVGRDVDEQTLHMLFVHCGQVTQIRIAGDPSYETRFAFIEFLSPEMASTACLLDGMNVFERSIKVSMARGTGASGSGKSGGGGSGGPPDPDRVTRTIHVGGIPMDIVSEEQLADYFKHVGEVNAVRKSGRFAWVEFETVLAANKALALDGESLGSSTLRISQSKTPIHTAGWRKGGAGPGPVGAPSSGGGGGGGGGGTPTTTYTPPPAPMAYGGMPPQGQYGYPPQHAYGAPPGGWAPPPPGPPPPGGSYGGPPPPGGHGGPPPPGPPPHHQQYPPPPGGMYGAPPHGPMGGPPPPGPPGQYGAY